MSDDVIIKVEGLWKRYGLPLVPAVRGLVTRLRNSKSSTLNERGPWALRDISFEVKRGETLGIIGRNGAGKSTLLKILAGVTPPTRGQIEVRGRVFPMIELNAGIHPELTGRENVRLLGAIMGLSRLEIEEKMPEIEEFTELEEWFNQPVRKYSSGMLARLGFGVAMNVEADILLVDEVLAVGDVGFQNRCLGRMKEYREAGKTILFVSHALEMVQYLCQQVMLLDKGEAIVEGKPEGVITQYENIQYHEDANYRARQHSLKEKFVFSTEDFLLFKVRVLNVYEQENRQIRAKDGFLVIFECESGIPIERLLFTFDLLNQKREPCLWDVIEGQSLGVSNVGRFNLIIAVPPLPLSGGSYVIDFAVRVRDSFVTLAKFKGIAQLVIEAQQRERGMLSVPLRWSVTEEQHN